MGSAVPRRPCLVGIRVNKFVDRVFFYPSQPLPASSWSSIGGFMGYSNPGKPNKKRNQLPSTIRRDRDHDHCDRISSWHLRAFLLDLARRSPTYSQK